MLTSRDMSDPNAIAGVSEHSQQCALLSAVAQIVKVNHKLTWLFAIPNGGDRNMAVAANMKAEGVKAGVADLLLPVAEQGYHGFFLEMKRPDRRNGQSDKQKEFQTFVVSEGYLYGVFYTWYDAFLALCWYLNIDVNSLKYSWIRSVS